MTVSKKKLNKNTSTEGVTENEENGTVTTEKRTDNNTKHHDTSTKPIASNNSNETEVQLDRSQLEYPTSEGKSKNGSNRAGALGIVFSNYGIRITIGGHVNKELNCPKKFQFAFTENKIAISENFKGNSNYFHPKVNKKTKKATIYSAGLVREIIDKFNLVFEGSKVSKTYYDVEYTTVDNHKVALIDIKK
ncbi:MAG: hypothetical protein FH753_04570 [Firmicutes bacterium]|nr:hypothetical protein [Bacillota bacterium]